VDTHTRQSCTRFELPGSSRRRGIMSLDSGWENLKLTDFTVLREIARSSTGAVYKARYNQTRQVVVLKERRCSEIGKYHDILHEVNLLGRLRHPNIIQYLGHFFHGERQHLFIVLEYAKYGDLFALIAARRNAALGKHNPDRDMVCLAIGHACVWLSG
jgi:serine/threonine protein kinase